MFSSRSVCCLPKLYTHAKILLGSSKQSSTGRGQKRPSVWCVTLAEAIHLFVSHVILRGRYTIYSEKQKALPAPAKSKPYLAVDLQHSEKLHRTPMLNYAEKRFAFWSLQVPARSQWVWGYDVNSSHVSHEIVRRVGSYLKFKGLLLSYLLKIIKS